VAIIAHGDTLLAWLAAGKLDQRNSALWPGGVAPAGQPRIGVCGRYVAGATPVSPHRPA
jgi:hypothetical protein